MSITIGEIGLGGLKCFSECDTGEDNCDLIGPHFLRERQSIGEGVERGRGVGFKGGCFYHEYIMNEFL